MGRSRTLLGAILLAVAVLCVVEAGAVLVAEPMEKTSVIEGTSAEPGDAPEPMLVVEQTATSSRHVVEAGSYLLIGAVLSGAAWVLLTRRRMPVGLRTAVGTQHRANW